MDPISLSKEVKAESLKKVEAYSKREITEGLKRLPVSTWRYDEEEGRPLHLGPMAQDFYKIFELGGSDREIAAVDALGVLITVCKELIERVEKLEKEIEESKD